MMSTFQSELAHKGVKSFYGLTNKKDPLKQIGQRYNRHRALHRSEVAQEQQEAEIQSSSLESHHYISRSKNSPLDIRSFIVSRRADPAVKVGDDL